MMSTKWSDPISGFDAQQLKALLQRCGCDPAYADATFTHAFFSLNKWNVLVEAAVDLGQVIEVISQYVRSMIFGRTGNRGREPGKFDRETTFNLMFNLY